MHDAVHAPHERPRLLLPNLAALAALLVVVAPPVPAHAEGAVPPHLPTRVNAPGPWSSDETVDGPIAAIGIATRREPRGLTGEREHLALFAVSATDGHSYWLPALDASLDTFALSPDGRYAAWARELPASAQAADRTGSGDEAGDLVDQDQDGESAPLLAGYSVLDTRSGHVHALSTAAEGPFDLSTTALRFSGDSRFLFTDGESAASQDATGTYVAWDLRSGKRSPLEQPGAGPTPLIGSAPTGVVLLRGREAFRRETLAGPATTLHFPTDVWAASWAPEGSGFAYIAAPRKRGGDAVLHVGRDVAAARTTTVALHPDGPLGRIVGWRDADHVVVDHYRRDLDVVDVRDGSVRNIDLAGAGKQLNTPAFAADLWSARLQDPAERTGLHDPRSIWRWGAAAGAVVLGVAVLRRIRVRP